MRNGVLQVLTIDYKKYYNEFEKFRLHFKRKNSGDLV